MIKLSPSLLAADFTNIERDVRQLEEAGIDMLHIDIMDGHFVPNITFGPDQIKQIRKITSLYFDVHLMIEDPENYIDSFAEAGCDNITIHTESAHHLNKTINSIKNHGIKVGVSLNPATSLTTLDYVLDDIDMILIMCVNPGYGGQKFIPNSIQKIKDTRKLIGDKNIDIEVDGGINLFTAPKVIEAGANVLVAGSYTFDGDILENIKKIKAVFPNV